MAELARIVPVAHLRKLKIGAGEHLAAILTTAYLGTAPAEIDTDGGADLVVECADDTCSLLPRGTRRAYFEVKSLPGDFRAFDAAIDRAADAGRTTPPDSFAAKVRSANDVLANEARTAISKAKRQLDRKAGRADSKNVFLIAHPFEYPTAECLSSDFLAHLLDPLDWIDDIDTVWILWTLNTLVVWSREQQRWTDLLVGGPQEQVIASAAEELDVLQRVEIQFLTVTEQPTSSPYLFALSVDPHKQPD